MLLPSLEFDSNFGPFVIGIDEAGYGPWAGPVVAAAVMALDSESVKSIFVQDSKKLSGSKREQIYEELTGHPHIIYSIGSATVGEIDQLNVRQANLLAMQRALDHESFHREGIVLIDGHFSFPSSWQTKSVIKGDQKSFHIAAASIIAKVTRDRQMRLLHGQFPMYGWDKNAGYGTKAHSEAIRQHGVTEHHRQTYAPIKAFLAMNTAS